jgi:predicted metal-binding membrane protein
MTTGGISLEARARRQVRTPVLVVTALAWLIIAIAPMTTPGMTHSDATTMGMAMPAGTGSMDRMSAHLSVGSLPGFLGMWLLMVVAMMCPLLICPLRHLGARTLPRRRASARILFLLAYTATWTLAGIVLLGMAGLLGRLASAVAVSGAIGVAALWQFAPGKQRCLNRHHTYPPLAVFGGRADGAALRFGAGHALWCAGSCSPLMLLPLVVPTDQLAVMAAVTLWIWAEQFEFPAVATWRVRVPTRAVLIVRAGIVSL